MEKRLVRRTKPFSWKSFFLQWEWMLVLIFIIVNVINAALSPYYMNMDNLRDATMSFLDQAFIVWPMACVIILGEIDISVASIVALSPVIMADLYRMGVPMELAIPINLAVGTICGLVNGLLIVNSSGCPRQVTWSTCLSLVDDRHATPNRAGIFVR
ncbi:ABC transporter permease [Paenibacillus sp. y28]|uniref:ABC transporter permease n=1 Tax=Paenibacillus sp. y28 TaxID=3129110 RepID=UPI0030188A06